MRNKTCLLGSGENENVVWLQLGDRGWTFKTGNIGPETLIK